METNSVLQQIDSKVHVNIIMDTFDMKNYFENKLKDLPVTENSVSISDEKIYNEIIQKGIDSKNEIKKLQVIIGV